MDTTLFRDNKYTNCYHATVARYKTHPVDRGEKHHIIPVSIGGEPGYENIVLIPSRVHFFLHKLLTKMCRSSEHQQKMTYALWRMMNPQTKKHDRTYRKNSREYERVRQQIVESMKTNNPMRRESIVARRRGVKRPDQSAVATRRNKKYWSDDDNKQRARDLAIRKAQQKNVKYWIRDLQTGKTSYYWCASDLLTDNSLSKSALNSLYSGWVYQKRYLLGKSES